MTLTLLFLCGLVVFFIVRKVSKSRNGKVRTSRGGRAGAREIVDSIESYLIRVHGLTAQPADGDHFSCYRDLNDNVQLFVTWHKAPYLQGMDLPRDSRTVTAESDAVSMTVCLLSTNGGNWKKQIRWGAVDRSSWNGKPKGLYTKPIDGAIRDALKVIKK